MINIYMFYGVSVITVSLSEEQIQKVYLFFTHVNINKKKIRVGKRCPSTSHHYLSYYFEFSCSMSKVDKPDKIEKTDRTQTRFFQQVNKEHFQDLCHTFK